MSLCTLIGTVVAKDIAMEAEARRQTAFAHR